MLFSLVLPATSLPVDPSPRLPLQSIEGFQRTRFLKEEDSDSDADDDVQPPRLSLPLEQLLESDEDDFMPVPHLSVLDDDTTQRSIELPRRAQSELVSDRFSRDSFGIRLSGRFDDLSELDEDLDTTLELRPPVFESYAFADDTNVPVLEDEEDGGDAVEIMEGESILLLELDGDGPEEGLGDADPAIAPSKAKPRANKDLKLSRYGTPVPALPLSMIKKVATRALASKSKARALADKEVMKAVIEATEMFFEQVSDDLGSYAQHAKRKTIDESDIVTLMRRQRQLSSSITPFSLAQRHLPRELLQELRMPVPPKLKPLKGPQQLLATVDEE